MYARPGRRAGADRRAVLRDAACPTPRRCCARSPARRVPSHTRLERDPRPAARPRLAPRRAATSRPAAATRSPAAARRTPPLATTGRAGHRFRCWFPVGTPEGAEALARNARAPRPRRPPPVRRGAIGEAADGRQRHRAPPRPRARRCCGPRTSSCEFPVGSHRAQGQRRVRRQPRRAARGDARARRRVRLRQVDHRQGDHAAAAADLGRGALRRARTLDRARRRGAARGPARAADDLPGPDLVAEPAPQGRRHRRRAPADLEAAAPPTSSGAGRRDARGRRHRPRRGPRPAPPRVLRRPVPAHLDRPGADARAEADHLRRAGVGARRVGAGPDPQPARGHEGAATASP